MLSGLMLSAFLMGLAGIPHCSAMCGAACAALLRKPLPLAALLGRLVGYAALGAVAATATTLAGQWSRQIAMLQPIWILAQIGAVMLGMWLLVTARMPALLEGWAHDLYRRVQSRIAASSSAPPSVARRLMVPLLAGMAWAALPCGLLYGAVTVAALGNTPLDGALIMAAFAVPSAFGLWVMPWLLAKAAPSVHQRAASACADGVNGGAPVIWFESRQVASEPELPVVPGWRGWFLRLTDPRWALRVAGLMLALMAGWAVYHRLLDQWNAWCA